MKRLDLAEVVLTLKASGIEDVAKFRWLEPPEPRALARAEQLLVDLGALRRENQITPLGPDAGFPGAPALRADAAGRARNMVACARSR